MRTEGKERGEKIPKEEKLWRLCFMNQWHTTQSPQPAAETLLAKPDSWGKLMEIYHRCRAANCFHTAVKLVDLRDVTH